MTLLASLRRWLAALALLLAAGNALAAITVRLGVLAVRPAEDVQTRWQPLARFLDQHVTDYDFEIQALGYAELEEAIARRTVDFVLTNPAHYVLMTYRNGLSSPLATLVPIENGRSLGKFGGVIFVRADRQELAGLEHLRNRTVAAVSQGSLGGYQAQAMELLQLGIEIPQDARLIETAFPHDRVVAAVLAGTADAGFVRTGVLEDMAGEGKLDLRLIRVLAPKQQPGFPLLLSTRLYPEWPIAVMPGVEEDLARQVAAALLSMPHGGKLAHELNIEGFTIPTDYDSVQATLGALRLPPFEGTPHFTFADIWHKYRWQLLAAMAFATIISLLAVLLVIYNRRARRSSEKWHRLLNALGEGVYGVDARGCCTFINPSALAMLGFTADEILGEDQHLMFHHHREDGGSYPCTECPVTHTLLDGETRVLEEWFLRKDGTGFPVMLTAAPMREVGAGAAAVVVFRDISDQRALQRQLQEQASTDALTGLANRRMFLERLNIELERFKRFGEPASLLMIDIDHFKKINDGYGHGTGDAVLRHFATQVRQDLRSIDLVGRLGGEEFGVLLPETSAINGLQFAERLRQLVASTPVPTEQGAIPFTISIGVAEFDEDDPAIDHLLARADAALYRAKDTGRNAVELFWSDHPETELVPAGKNPVVRLIWKSRYACGEPTIDAQHRQLFDLANSLLERLATRDSDPHAFTIAFDALLAHVKQHFADEEEILRSRGYAQQDRHADSHRHMLEHALALRDRAGPSGVSIGELVEFLITEVVAGHMLREDRDFYALFARPRQDGTASR